MTVIGRSFIVKNEENFSRCNAKNFVQKFFIIIEKQLSKTKMVFSQL